MLCAGCNTEHDCSDFYLNKNICYRCLYKQKIFLLKLEEKTKEYTCRICKKKFHIDKEKKIRQRNIYCSSECSKISHKEQMTNFWTNRVNLRLVFK